MDIALAVFNIGAGLGVLGIGAALIYLAWQATPLIRESRALTADLRRLTRTAEGELRPILASTKELTGNVEVLSEDVAVKLDRLTDIMNALQQGIERGHLTVGTTPPPPVSGPEPVDSWETREDRPGS